MQPIPNRYKINLNPKDKLVLPLISDGKVWRLYSNKRMTKKTINTLVELYNIQ